MASIAASLLALLLVAPLAVYGATFKVEWTLSGDYSAWPSKNVYVGDEIVFTYSTAQPKHNVYVVSDKGSCDTTGASFSDDSGNTKYPLTKEGPVYFICGIAGHCPRMQLQLNVKAASSSSSNNTSPPDSSSPAPPTPTTSKDKGAASAHGFSWLVVGVSVVFATLLNVAR